jgi:hypothetical protein
MDHLVLGVPDLAQGVDLVERKTGVRAQFGGKHPGRGTHNALLSFGNRQYLEIIAVDHEQPSTTEVLFAGLRDLKEPRFVGWATAVADVGEVARRAKAAGIATVGPLDGARRQADGSMLEWKTLRLASELELAPFFIAWGRTTHPSETTPKGCRLLSFAIEHPKADELRKLLAALGAEAEVCVGAKARLVARLDTPKGEVEL